MSIVFVQTCWGLGGIGEEGQREWAGLARIQEARNRIKKKKKTCILSEYSGNRMLSVYNLDISLPRECSQPCHHKGDVLSGQDLEVALGMH